MMYLLLLSVASLCAGSYHRRLCLLLCLMAASRPADAAPGGHYHVAAHYTVADGLVDNGCIDIYTTSQGFMWICSTMGLSRFDGRSFENYTTRSGLRENYICVVDNDDQEHIWVATLSGIACYTGTGSRPFTNYATELKGINGMTCGRDRYIYYLVGVKNELYVLHNGRTSKVPGVSGQITALEHDALGNAYILSHTGMLYQATAGRLVNHWRLPAAPLYSYILRVVSGSIMIQDFYRHRLLVTGRQGVKDTLPTPHDRFISSVGNYSGRCYNYYMGRQLLRSNARQQWDTLLRNDDLRLGFIYNLREAGDGTLWLATSNGIYHLAADGQEEPMPLTSILHYLSTPDAGGNPVFHRDSALWRIPAIRHWYQKLQPVLKSIYRGRDGTVWFSTADGLYHIPPNGRQAEHYKAPILPGTDSNYKNYGMTVLEDVTGRAWFGRYFGMDSYARGRYRAYKPKESSDYMGALATDAAGIVYAGNSRLYALQPGSDSIICLSRRLKLPYDAIVTLVRGPDGCVWICQNNSMLRKITRHPQRGFYIADSLQLDFGGAEVIPRSITFDRYGNLWVAAKQLQVYLRDPSSNRPATWRRRLLPEPLQARADLQLYNGADSDSCLYICTPSAYGNSVTRYSIPHSLQDIDRFTPRLIITEIRLFGQRQDWKAAGFRVDAMGIPQQPVLAHNQNFISFQFTALTPGLSRWLAYRYRIPGLNERWVYTGARTEADFANLGAGSYLFEVAAMDATGTWSAPYSYSFTVLPVWYATWWARLLLVSLCICAISTAFYLRLRMYRRQVHMRQMVTEEQLRALRAQINPHFLQNLFEFLAWQFKTAPHHKTVQYIHHISSYLRKVLYRTDENVLTLEDELAFTEEYIRIQQLVHPIAFEYEVTVSDDVDTYELLVPCMLLQPTVENSLKYGLATHGNNRIAINVTGDDSYVYCIVRDSGSGQPVPAKPPGYKSKGQQLTLQRMILLYGKMQLRPAVYQVVNETGGLTVTLQIPLK